MANEDGHDEDREDTPGTPTHAPTEAISSCDRTARSMPPPRYASGRRLIAGTTLANGQLTIQHAIGEGGMGLVYEAWDAERRSHVALKTLSNVEPEGVYSFKNEFRLLAEMRHPNLVQLHELFAEGPDFWFFTMELIHGETFSQWVRPGDQLDEWRLREALQQLLAAVAVIHSVGRLHRDLKPSNVLVSHTGRVVVLDFGLAIERAAGGVGQTVQSLTISGTPAYMAPEISAGVPASTASDLYAVGVMLFESLVGRLPFPGNAPGVLFAKQHRPAPRPGSLVKGLPADLEALCTALLERDPMLRPALTSIQSRLGTPRRVERPSDPSPVIGRFLGRATELQVLHDAYAATLAGSSMIVAITGESGIGKTALCEHFLRELRTKHASVVLAGRCREQETVPFKALDTVIDELSRYMRRLPDGQAAALLPRDSFALRRLFPVLGRVNAIAQAPPPADFNPQELRRRGFSALGELLARVRDRQPLVICMDDLHWTDADSVALLRHLLFDRQPTPALLIIAYRSEHAENPLVASVLDAAASNPDVHLQSLELRPLGLSEAEQLATHLLEAEGVADPQLSAAIARESGGSPFFAIELVRSARMSGNAALAVPSIRTALLTRIGLLPPGSRKTLELLALVGHPMPIDVINDAIAASFEDLDVLRDAQLVRSREHGGRRALECYHDRIRQAVNRSLSPQVRTAHYAALATVLAAREDASPELQSTCLENVGELDGAARYAVAAAEQASASMAFDRAAMLYQRALALTTDQGSGRRELIVKLGEALENAGRGQAAASSYREAARSCAGSEAIELRRRAAEQLLATGHLNEGLALITDVCREATVPIPIGKHQALASYALNRLQLRIRGFQRRAVPGQPFDERERLRLRVARTLVTGLVGYLPLQTASSAGRYLLMALEHGETDDLIRGLGFHAYIQTLVEPTGRYANMLLDRMDALASQAGTPEAFGFASLIRGASAYHCGRFTVARAHLSASVRALRDCYGLDWEIDCANVYDQLVASDSGEYAHIARTTPPLIDDALRRGRVWTAAMLSGFGVHAWLVPDNPAGYETLSANVKRQWRGTRQPRWPDFVLLAGASQQLIYQGDPVAAFELMESEYDRFRQSEVKRSAGAGIGGYAVHHGRAASAALQDRRSSASLRRRARSVLRDAVSGLRRQGGAKRTGIAGTLDAALALDAGEFARAQLLLAEAAEILDSTGLRMLAAAARRRAGQLAGGIEGAALVALGDAFIESQAVKNTEAMTEVSCPGVCPR